MKRLDLFIKLKLNFDMRQFISFFLAIFLLIFTGYSQDLEKKYEDAKSLYLDQKPEESLKAFKEILTETEKEKVPSLIKAKTLFSIGKINYFYVKDNEEALNYFNLLIEEFPYTNLTDDALYYTAKILLKQGHRKEAEDKLKVIITKHLESDFYRKALLLLNDNDPDLIPVKTKFIIDDNKKDDAQYDIKEEPLISLDLEDIPFKTFIERVSELTNTNYQIPDNLKGKVSLISPKKIPVSEVKNILEHILNIRGFSTVQKDDYVTIVPLNKALTESEKITSGASIESDKEEIITHIVEIKYGNASEISSTIKQILNGPSRTFIYSKNSLIIVVGYRSTVKKALKFIKDLDIKIIEPVIRIFHLDNVMAADVVNKLNNIISSLVNIRGLNLQSKFIPEVRTNSIITLTSEKILPFIKHLISELDVKEEIKTIVKIIKLKHLEPQAAVQQIQNLLQASFQSQALEIQHTKIVPDIRQNAIIVASPAETVIKLIEDYIGKADVEVELKRPLIKVFPLTNADEEKVEKYVIDILGSEGESYKGMLKKTKIIADKRLNAIIVSSKYSQVIDDAEHIIKQLDTPVDIKKSNLHIYKLQNADAKNVSEVLSRLTIPDPKTPNKRKPITSTFDESTNSVVITADPEEYQHILKIIKEFDTQKKQVLIRVLVAEVSVDQTTELGIEWMAGGKIKNTNYSAGVSQNVGMAANSITADKNAKDVAKSLLGLSVGIIKDDGTDVGAIIRANQNNSNFNILSTPSIVTENNSEAIIDVGDKVPYITQTRITDNDNSIYSYAYEIVGITLKMTPHINNSDMISLEIDHSSKNLLEKYLYGNIPLTSTREIKTKVTVQNGKTIVIGGLIKNHEEKSTAATPFFSKIPILGYMFRKKDTTLKKTNLLVIITPTIIRDFDDITLPENKSDKFNEKLKESDFFGYQPGKK